MSNALPFLPGYATHYTTKKDFHKSHLFDVQNGIPVDTHKATELVDTYTFPVSGQEETLRLTKTSNFQDSQNAQYTTSNAALNNTSSSLPAWIAYDRKVLRFYAYFKEAVFSSPVEKFRLRKCVVYYYLEDDSVHIAEPKVENSGLPQGVFVKRHRVPKANNELVNLNDLQIGQDINIYGRQFRMYDCDDFTRAFFQESGFHQPAPEECPLDAFTKKHTVEPGTFKKLMHPMKEFQEASLGKQMGVNIQATQKFLKNDRKVLRFFCVWDDENLFGEKRPYVLHYYLADDTLEVMEVKEANNGRDLFPAMSKRGKLPKEHSQTAPDLSQIGARATAKVQFYTEKDLRVGSFVNVYGRQMLISRVDEFTKTFYKMNYGFTDEDFPEIQEGSAEEPTPRIEPPPPTGYGNDADSLGSFLYLMPKVPKVDFKKQVENDRLNLRWSCKLSKPSPEDRDRQFILTYFMSDDTISIFEKFCRNSGFIGGKFLERKKIKNLAEDGRCYTTKDITAGTTITLNYFDFDIIEPDAFTGKFISDNASMFSDSYRP